MHVELALKFTFEGCTFNVPGKTLNVYKQPWGGCELVHGQYEELQCYFNKYTILLKFTQYILQDRRGQSPRRSCHSGFLFMYSLGDTPKFFLNTFEK